MRMETSWRPSLGDRTNGGCARPGEETRRQERCSSVGVMVVVGAEEVRLVGCVVGWVGFWRSPGERRGTILVIACIGPSKACLSIYSPLAVKGCPLTTP